MSRSRADIEVAHPAADVDPIWRAPHALAPARSPEHVAEPGSPRLHAQRCHHLQHGVSHLSHHIHFPFSLFMDGMDSYNNGTTWENNVQVMQMGDTWLIRGTSGYIFTNLIVFFILFRVTAAIIHL